MKNHFLQYSIIYFFLFFVLCEKFIKRRQKLLWINIGSSVLLGIILFLFTYLHNHINIYVLNGNIYIIIKLFIMWLYLQNNKYLSSGYIYIFI